MVLFKHLTPKQPRNNHDKTTKMKENFWLIVDNF